MSGIAPSSGRIRYQRVRPDRVGAGTSDDRRDVQGTLAFVSGEDGYRVAVSSAGARAGYAAWPARTCRAAVTGCITVLCVTGCAATVATTPIKTEPAATVATATSATGSVFAAESDLGSAGPTPSVGSAAVGDQTGNVPMATAAPGSSSPAESPGTPVLARPERPATPSSPLLFPQVDGQLAAERGPAGALQLNSADGQTRDGEPYRPLVFTASNLWLVPTGGATEFALAIDAGQTVGAATQLRISYDTTGDGTWDRVETYRYFATDPEPGAELYTEQSGLLAGQGTAWAELTGGTVQVEIWSAIGDGGTTLELDDSSITLPFS